MTPKQSSRNIFIVNFYTFCISSVFILPVIMAFYRDELGLTFQQFLLGEALFAATVILMDVPTGYIADRWGRRKTLLTGGIAGIIGYSCLALAVDFFTATLSQMMIGVAVALNSGTIGALLYDTLLTQNRAHEFRKREGFRHALSLYTVAAASIIGGFLYQFDHYLPIILEIITISCGTVALYFIHEPERHRVTSAHHPLKDIFLTVHYAVKENVELLAMMWLVTLVFAMTKIMMWLQQPYATALQIPEYIYGFVLAAGMMSGGLVGHVSHRVWPKLDGITLLIRLLLVVIFITLCSGFLMNYAGLVVLLCGSLVFGFGWPRMQDSVNKMVGSERRATILSAVSFCHQLGFLPLSILAGFLDENYSVGIALIGLSITITFLGFASFAFLKLRRIKPSTQS
jgi:MFS family permease